MGHGPAATHPPKEGDQVLLRLHYRARVLGAILQQEQLVCLLRAEVAQQQHAQALAGVDCLRRCAGTPCTE